MKLYWLLFAFTLFISCSETSEQVSGKKSTDSVFTDRSAQGTTSGITKLKVDSVRIYDSIAGDPFPFPHFNVSFHTVKAYMPAGTSIAFREQPADSDPDYILLIQTLRFKNSTIEFYGDTAEGAIYHASIEDPEIVLLRNIRIGDTYESVVSRLDFGELDPVIVSKIYIDYGEANNTLVLVFKEGKLARIDFWPYTG